MTVRTGSSGMLAQPNWRYSVSVLLPVRNTADQKMRPPRYLTAREAITARSQFSIGASG